MDAPKPYPSKAVRSQGSDRTALRDVHHARAQAVARGETLNCPESVRAIFESDPAFQNLVAYYQRCPA